MDPKHKLKLKAEDSEDITIISTYLQDAVSVLKDVVFQPKTRQFVMMLNRYVWEEYHDAEGAETTDQTDDQKFDQTKAQQKKDNNCFRIRTGLHFENVLSVNSQNIPQKNESHVLELLAIESRKSENKNMIIDLIFAGEAVIRLEAELIDAQMQDIGEPWKAACHPKHSILDAMTE